MSRSLVTGLVAWFFTTLALTSLLSVGGWLWGGRQAHRMRFGWHLKTVVLTTRAMPAGTVLSPDDLTTGGLPEQFVTDSLVPVADLRTVLGRRLTVDVSKNDAVAFAHFAPRPHPLVGCVDAARKAASVFASTPDAGVDEFLARLEVAVDRELAAGGTRELP
ncbi:MAG: hypothetical protein JNJ54_32200 [Myxococcaceae bacterium]|nr:hypothetical protein [Myxococcaceae bacterium]